MNTPTLTRCLLTASLFTFLLTGCDRTDPAQEDDETRRGRFGDSYELLSNFSSADPDLYPMLQSDTLFARVTYPGGCEDHEFELDSQIRQDTAYVWLYHDAGGDACEAQIQEEIVLPLEDDILEQGTVVMLNPAERAPHLLRSNR